MKEVDARLKKCPMTTMQNGQRPMCLGNACMMWESYQISEQQVIEVTMKKSMDEVLQEVPDGWRKLNFVPKKAKGNIANRPFIGGGLPIFDGTLTVARLIDSGDGCCGLVTQEFSCGVG